MAHILVMLNDLVRRIESTRIVCIHEIVRQVLHITKINIEYIVTFQIRAVFLISARILSLI